MFRTKKSESGKKSLRVALLAFGSMVQPCLEVGKLLNFSVINMRFVKPIDIDMLKNVAESHDLLVTVEEHVKMGGAGSACLEALSSIKLQDAHAPKFLHLGLPDRNIDHGDCETLLKREGLDFFGIKQSVEKFINEELKISL
jgi:1-deoxy-D-xylulose-5-phosphate synthase